MAHTASEERIQSRNMKAIFSHKGKAIVSSAVVPELEANHVLIQTVYSGVSNGTERLMIMINHEEPISLGYSACGIVSAVGEGVDHVKPGDRVACYGAPFVRHAEYMLVPKHLTTLVPDDVDMKEAAFVGLGAIAIHALRQAKLEFGESAIIVGLGILGQIMAQISSAAAYETIVYDLQPDRCELFESLSIGRSAKSLEELESVIAQVTGGKGVDAVLLAANGKNNGLIDGGLDWIRDRGRVVIVGDLEMSFSRDKMFKKEAEVRISRAGGPGRYDMNYEAKGQDYPIGFARWTEGRNMTEYIRLLQQRRISVAPLISQEVHIDDIAHMYEQLFLAQTSAIGTLITY